MPTEPATSRRSAATLVAAVLCLVAGATATAVSLQGVLSDSETAAAFMSRPLWESAVRRLSAPAETEALFRVSEGRLIADVPWPRLWTGSLVIAAACWLAGGSLIAIRRRMPWTQALSNWGLSGWLWWVVPGIREGLMLAAAFAGLDSLSAFLLATPQFCYAILLAGWVATFLALMTRGAHAATQAAPNRTEGSSWNSVSLWSVAAMMCVYFAVFTAMNWQLYRGLLTPHGDTAMYEEHLWNVLHGKGFRSYLDQGLFLGEHIQVVHLLLIPIYLLWPSHLLLELCQSLAIASGALPVFWLAQRHTGSSRAGALLAAAYLLYFPLQFLDIAIDLKTFRPIAFGVPLVLFALDQLERRRYRTMIVLLLLALSAKEDYTIILAPLGVWMALRQARASGQPNRWRLFAFGLGIAVFATAYLVVATRWVIPWFRGGEELHYVRYFSKLGENPREIVWNMLTKPALLGDLLLTLKTALYALAMLAPLGFLPLLSPGRLSVGLPLFVTLCLNELTRSPWPWHHFHAPLIAIVFWAAAAGLGTAQGLWGAWSGRRAAEGPPLGKNEPPVGNGSVAWPAYFAFASALATGVFFSLSPLGREFWDPGSEFHWRKLYVPGTRAAMFARIEGTIPKDARVASTDFVHPRFTHCERSYDYSQYPRAVNDNQPGAPPDTDYIVIDTTHRYSTIRRPDQIPEYREHPERWEVLPDPTEGYFIVLKRTGNH